MLAELRDEKALKPPQELRKSKQENIALTAAYRTSLGPVMDAVLSNTSAEGSRITASPILLNRGQRVTIRPEFLEGLTGQVC